MHLPAWLPFPVNIFFLSEAVAFPPNVSLVCACVYKLLSQSISHYQTVLEQEHIHFCFTVVLSAILTPNYKTFFLSHTLE